MGIRFYTKDGEIVLRTAFDWNDEDPTYCKTHTVHLEDGKRVIGYKSRFHTYYNGLTDHRDFQLIIGWLISP